MKDDTKTVHWMSYCQSMFIPCGSFVICVKLTGSKSQQRIFLFLLVWTKWTETDLLGVIGGPHGGFTVIKGDVFTPKWHNLHLRECAFVWGCNNKVLMWWLCKDTLYSVMLQREGDLAKTAHQVTKVVKGQQIHNFLSELWTIPCIQNH